MDRLEQLEKEELELEKAVFGNPKDSEGEQGDAQATLKNTEAPKAQEGQQVVSTEADKSTVPMQTEVPSGESELTQITKRFNNYKATKDKQIHQLRLEVSTLSGRLGVALDEVKRLQALTVKDEGPQSYFSADDEKALGKEAKEVLERVQRTAYERNVKPLLEAEERRMKEERKNLEDKRIEEHRKAMEAFNSALTRYAPTWEANLSDPNFRKFIKGANKYGTIHEDRFRDAEKVFDVETLADIFNQYEASKGISPELEKHIMPSSGSSAAKKVQAKEGDIIIDRAFVDKFYKDCLAGVYSSSAEKIKEGEQIEAAIDAYLAGTL